MNPIKSAPGIAGTAVMAGIAILAGTTIALAHIDDPKASVLHPMYEGPGYRADLPNAAGGPQFPASNVELLAWIPIPEFNDFDTEETHVSANDCWGYTSPSGREYAIIGLSDGTAFVEVTNPGNPQIIEVISGPNSLWRDVKVYQHHAYMVSEGGGGIQVVSMQQIDNGFVQLINTVNDVAPASTHNVALNTESGYLYRCGGALGLGIRIYDLSTPGDPQWVATWSDRYVHDAQPVTLNPGQPNEREIVICCSGFNNGGTETGVDVLDVTDKQNIFNITGGFFQYPQPAYSHQAWLSPDNRYLYLNDELDEGGGNHSTMHVIDMLDPENPVVLQPVTNNSTAVTHNLYTRDNFIFAANYRSGLRIFDTSEDPASPVEVAFFDTYPSNDGAEFNSLWSNYPYLPSGIIIGSDIEQGLFVWRFLAVEYPEGQPELFAAEGESLRVDILGAVQPGTAKVVYDIGDGPQEIPLTSIGVNEYQADFPNLPCGEQVNYYITAFSPSGVLINSPASAPADTFEAIVADSLEVLVDNDFESDSGWTTENLGAGSGQWQRGVPLNDPGWDYDPLADADGSGQAWLTQNDIPGNTDIDDGSVRLTSSSFDFSESTGFLSYSYFLRLTDEDGVDRLLVEMSSNGAAGPWIEAARHDTNGGLAWREHRLTAEDVISAGVSLSADMRIRFTANDGDDQSIVEAGVDAFKVTNAVCGTEFLPTDINQDSNVDVFDMLEVLENWGDCSIPCPPTCAPDTDDSCGVDVFDLLAILNDWTG